MKKILILFLAFIVASCGTSTSDTPSNTDDSTQITDNDNPNSNKDDSNKDDWAAFWQKFQEAVKSGDVAAIKQTAIWNEAFDEKGFDEMQQYFFTPEMVKLIGKTAAEDVPQTESVEEYATSGKEISLAETGYDEEEDITYESALFLYFGKINGKYGLVMWMAAG